MDKLVNDAEINPNHIFFLKILTIKKKYAKTLYHILLIILIFFYQNIVNVKISSFFLGVNSWWIQTRNFLPTKTGVLHSTDIDGDFEQIWTGDTKIFSPLLYQLNDTDHFLHIILIYFHNRFEPNSDTKIFSLLVYQLKPWGGSSYSDIHD